MLFEKLESIFSPSQLIPSNLERYSHFTSMTNYHLYFVSLLIVSKHV